MHNPVAMPMRRFHRQKYSKKYIKSLKQKYKLSFKAEYSTG